MIFIMQNFGSKPKINCSTITEAVMIIGFLYLIIFAFILAASRVWRTARGAIIQLN